MRAVVRLSATYDGQTYVYSFPPEEAEDAARIIAGHVAEGRLHPTAGSILVRMAFREMRDE